MSFGDFWIQQNNERKERLQAPKESFGKERLDIKFAHLFDFFDKDRNGKLNADEMEFLSYSLSAARGDNILTSAESKESIFSDLGEEKADFLEFVKAISDAVKYSKTEELPNGEKRIITEYKNGITDTIYYYQNGDFKFKITEKKNFATIDKPETELHKFGDGLSETRIKHNYTQIELDPDRFVYLSEQASEEAQLKNFIFRHFTDTNTDAQKAINSVEWLDKAGNIIEEGFEAAGFGKDTNNLSKMQDGIKANKPKADSLEQFTGNAEYSADLYFGEYENRFKNELKHNYAPEKAIAFRELINRYQTATYLNQCIDLISKAQRELESYEADFFQKQNEMPGDNINPMSHITKVVDILTQLFNDKDAAETMVNQMGMNEKGKFDITYIVEQLKEMKESNKNKLAETLDAGETEHEYYDEKGVHHKIKIISKATTYEQLKEKYIREYKAMYNVDTVPEEVLDKVMSSKEWAGGVKIAIILAIQMAITKQVTPVLSAGGAAAVGGVESAININKLNAFQKVIQGLILTHGVQKVANSVNFAVQAGFVPADIGLGLVSAMTSKEGLTTEKTKEIFINGLHSAKYVGFGYAVTGRMSLAISQNLGKIGLGKRLFNGIKPIAKGKKVIKGAEFITKLSTGVMHYVGKGAAFIADGAAFGAFDAATSGLEFIEASENAFKMQLEIGIARHFLEMMLGVKVHAKITEAKQRANVKNIDIIEDTNGAKTKYIVQNEGETLFETDNIDIATAQVAMISQIGFENYKKAQGISQEIKLSAEGQKLFEEIGEYIKTEIKDEEKLNNLLNRIKQLDNPIEAWLISLEIAKMAEIKETAETGKPDETKLREIERKFNEDGITVYQVDESTSISKNNGKYYLEQIIDGEHTIKTADSIKELFAPEETKARKSNNTTITSVSEMSKEELHSHLLENLTKKSASTEVLERLKDLLSKSDRAEEKLSDEDALLVEYIKMCDRLFDVKNHEEYEKLLGEIEITLEQITEIHTNNTDIEAIANYMQLVLSDVDNRIHIKGGGNRKGILPKDNNNSADKSTEQNLNQSVLQDFDGIISSCDKFFIEQGTVKEGESIYTPEEKAKIQELYKKNPKVVTEVLNKQANSKNYIGKSEHYTPELIEKMIELSEKIPSLYKKFITEKNNLFYMFSNNLFEQYEQAYAKNPKLTDALLKMEDKDGNSRFGGSFLHTIVEKYDTTPGLKELIDTKRMIDGKEQYAWSGREIIKFINGEYSPEQINLLKLKTDDGKYSLLNEDNIISVENISEYAPHIISDLKNPSRNKRAKKELLLMSNQVATNMFYHFPDLKNFLLDNIPDNTYSLSINTHSSDKSWAIRCNSGDITTTMRFKRLKKDNYEIISKETLREEGNTSHVWTEFPDGRVQVDEIEYENHVLNGKIKKVEKNHTKTVYENNEPVYHEETNSSPYIAVAFDTKSAERGINNPVTGKAETFGTKNPANKITKEYTHSNGMKTTSTIIQGEKGGKSTYTITDKNGKVIANITRTNRQISENHYKSSVNGQNYDIVFVGDEIIVSRVDKNGKKVETIKCESNIFDPALKDLYKQIPGDYFFMIKKMGIKRIEINPYETSASADSKTGIISISPDMAKNPFVFVHELGHMIDSILLNELNSSPTLKKIFLKEYKQYQSSASYEEGKIIEYFTHIEDGGYDVKVGRELSYTQEIIAETNALISGLQNNAASIAMRAIELQKHFPETMAFIIKRLNNLSKQVAEGTLPQHTIKGDGETQTRGILSRENNTQKTKSTLPADNWENINKALSQNFGGKFNPVQTAILKELISPDNENIVETEVKNLERLLNIKELSGEDIIKLLTSDKFDKKELENIDEYAQIARENGFNLVDMMESTEADFNKYIEETSVKTQHGIPIRATEDKFVVTDSREKLFAQLEKFGKYNPGEIRKELKNLTKEQVKLLSQIENIIYKYKEPGQYHSDYLYELKYVVENIKEEDLPAIEHFIRTGYSVRDSYERSLKITKNNPAKKKAITELEKLKQEFIKLKNYNTNIRNYTIYDYESCFFDELENVETMEQAEALIYYLHNTQLSDMFWRDFPPMSKIKNVEDVKRWTDLNKIAGTNYTNYKFRQFKNLFMELSLEDRALFNYASFMSEAGYDLKLSTVQDIIHELISKETSPEVKSKIRELIKLNQDEKLLWKWNKCRSFIGDNKFMLHTEQLDRVIELDKTGIKYDDNGYNDMISTKSRQGTDFWTTDSQFNNIITTIKNKRIEEKLGRKLTIDEADDFTYIKEDWQREWVISKIKKGMKPEEVSIIMGFVMDRNYCKVKNKAQLKLADAILKCEYWGIKTTDGAGVSFDYHIFEKLTTEENIKEFCKILASQPIETNLARFYLDILDENFAVKVQLKEKCPHISELFLEKKEYHTPLQNIIKYMNNEYQVKMLEYLDTFIQKHPELREKISSFAYDPSHSNSPRILDIRTKEDFEKVLNNLKTIDSMSKEDCEILAEISDDAGTWDDKDFARNLAQYDFNKEYFDILKEVYKKDRGTNNENDRENKDNFTDAWLRYEKDADILRKICAKADNLDDVREFLYATSSGDNELKHILLDNPDFTINMVIDVVARKVNSPTKTWEQFQASENKTNMTLNKVKKFAKTYKEQGIPSDVAIVMMMDFDLVDLKTAEAIAYKCRIEKENSAEPEEPTRIIARLFDLMEEYPELGKILINDSGFNYHHIQKLRGGWGDRDLSNGPIKNMERTIDVASNYKKMGLTQEEAYIVMLNTEITTEIAKKIATKVRNDHAEICKRSGIEKSEESTTGEEQNLARLVCKENEEVMRMLLDDANFDFEQIKSIIAATQGGSRIVSHEKLKEVDYSKIKEIAATYKQKGIHPDCAYIMMLNPKAVDAKLADKILAISQKIALAEHFGETEYENMSGNEKVLLRYKTFDNAKDITKKVTPLNSKLTEFLLDSSEFNHDRKLIQNILNAADDPSYVLDLLKNYNNYELTRQQALDIVFSRGSLTLSGIRELNKKFGRENVEKMNADDKKVISDFIDVLDVKNINEITMAGKRKFLRKLVDSRDGIIRVSPEYADRFPILPKSLDEYCPLVRQIVKAVGIDTEPLTPMQRVQLFNHSMKNLSNAVKELSDKDFANLKITQEYSREDFINSVKEKLKDLTELEKRKVFDYYGFELHHNRHNSTNYTLTGYPHTLSNGEKLAQIENPKTRAAIEAIKPDVTKFTKQNRIKCNNPKVEALLNDILDGLPEIRTMIGRVQHCKYSPVTDGSKVTYEIANSTEYREVNAILNRKFKRKDIDKLELRYENDKVICNNEELRIALEKLVAKYPELKSSLGLTNIGSHDFDVMQHSLKVMQKLVQDKKFDSLSESDKKIMLLASLLHDITKSEGFGDRTHAEEGSFDAFYISKKFNLSKDECIKLYTLIKHHEWLGYVNTQKTEYALTKALQSVAYDLQNDNLFELSLMFTHADLKAVRKDDSFHDKVEGSSRRNFRGEVHSFGQAADIHATKIREYIKDLKKTKPIVPTTNMPSASRIKEGVKEIHADGTTDIPGVYIDADGHVIVKYNELQNEYLERIGFPKGSLVRGIQVKGQRTEKDRSITVEEVNTGNIKFIVHGLEYPNQLAKFDAFALPDSEVLLSISYAERPESKWKFFRAQGVIPKFRNKYIHAGGETDVGSGTEKFLSRIKRDYTFGGYREGDRRYVSDHIKEATGMGDEEYINFVEENQDKSHAELDPKTSYEINQELSMINSKVRGMGDRSYNEFYGTNAECLQGTFAWDMDGMPIGNAVDFVNRQMGRLSFLREYDLQNNVAMWLFGD